MTALTFGWGDDSVYAIAKHYVGDGAAEGGRNDHFDSGRSERFSPAITSPRT